VGREAPLARIARATTLRRSRAHPRGVSTGTTRHGSRGTGCDDTMAAQLLEAFDGGYSSRRVAQRRRRATRISRWDYLRVRGRRSRRSRGRPGDGTGGPGPMRAVRRPSGGWGGGSFAAPGVTERAGPVRCGRYDDLREHGELARVDAAAAPPAVRCTMLLRKDIG